MNQMQRIRQGYLQNAGTGAYAHGQMNGHGMAGAAMAGGACPTRNVNDANFSCQGAMSEEDLPPVLGCNVLGGNTFNLNVQGGAGVGLGVPTATNVAIAIDAGDACRYRSRSLLIASYVADAATPNIVVAGQVPTLLTNARIGSIPQIRRTGALQFGIISDGYSDRKELTCVDWAPFTSVQNQGLTLEFYNLLADTVHIFADIWGDNLS